MGKEKPIRESDKILYHSRFGISIDPERIMHNINRYYLKNVFINSVCLGMIIWLYVYIYYSEFNNDAKARRSAYIGRFWAYLGLGDEYFNKSAEEKVSEA